MNQDVLEVWSVVVNEKNARLKLDKELRTHLSSESKHIERCFLQSKEFFWTSQINMNNWEVRAKWNINICSNYFESKCCIKGRCRKIHMCKDYLFGDNYCKMDDCHFSHDINDSHNLTVLQSLNLPIISISVIRNSFPRLCGLLLDTGKCTKKFCGYLHLCYKHMKGCCNESNCHLALKSGLDNVHDLQSLHNQFVLEIFNLHKEKVETITDNILLRPIVKPSKKNFSMCKFYLDGNCNMGKCCQHLHICKNFLLPIKRCMTDKCEKRLSHDPFDEHNKPIVEERQLLHLKKEELTKLLKESFPKICRAYQRREQCCGCNRIHMCPDFLGAGCENLKCNLSHNYKDNHNGNVLYSYGFGALLKPNVKDEYIKVNILWLFASFKETSVAVTKRMSLNQKGPSLKGRRIHEGMPTSRPVVARFRRPDSNLSFQSDILQPPAQMSKEDFFDFMINTFDNGYAAISDTRLLDFFKADESAVKKWILKEKSNFRLLCHKDGNISVAVYDINIEPCQHFWSENGCDDEDCGKFHICKKVILQIPHDKHTCRFSHEFSTSSNDRLIEENDLANLTNEQILILLRNRYPKVCKEYQNNQCTEGISFCEKLHVCLDLIAGNCKKSEALCGLLHENGLYGKQSARLMQEFNLEQDCFPLCLYYEDIVIALRFTTDGRTFNALKEETICSSYISGTRNKKTCHLIHPRFNSQYVWQERKKGTESWEDCQQASNEKIEKAFCDPNRDYFEYK